jgi:ABC-type uncharacterized transport system permease subunit
MKKGLILVVVVLLLSLVASCTSTDLGYAYSALEQADNSLRDQGIYDGTYGQ